MNGTRASVKIGIDACDVGVPTYANNANTRSSLMNFLVFSAASLDSYWSSRVRSSICRPWMPPSALTWSIQSLAPERIWIPSCAAGPLNAADWPMTTVLSVTPSWALAGAAAAIASAKLTSMPIWRIMSPSLADAGRNGR